ncbi:hypothetical protein NBO_898g0001 [Nosema bombycis CQ1]|uniref:Uncharacterized protein n=1 Tax=Nosema bombycis (strain CQ1 / CVCC 102059) TaxID=578461 RepID=R0MG83_NOSB1|nr:hypothetical protein NBO_898g0001 [Nosema bombycis CQ1]|eukprot:EOB11763.1 hypothetical protein NBO_898g0001 [Nosema bombycis CQ1]
MSSKLIMSVLLVLHNIFLLFIFNKTNTLFYPITSFIISFITPFITSFIIFLTNHFLLFI